MEELIARDPAPHEERALKDGFNPSASIVSGTGLSVAPDDMLFVVFVLDFMVALRAKLGDLQAPVTQMVLLGCLRACEDF